MIFKNIWDITHLIIFKYLEIHLCGYSCHLFGGYAIGGFQGDFEGVILKVILIVSMKKNFSCKIFCNLKYQLDLKFMFSNQSIILRHFQLSRFHLLQVSLLLNGMFYWIKMTARKDDIMILVCNYICIQNRSHNIVNLGCRVTPKLAYLMRVRIFPLSKLYCTFKSSMALYIAAEQLE